NALAAQQARAAREESGLTDEQWWEANGPLLARVLDPAAYPTAARVGSAAGAAQGGAYSADHAWEFGLQRALDGLAALI
ncbi:MAG TPA: TetR/AcrR family transcriptional regulator C-terminal domain-containing protein, partial [Solirubrobacteraceae bacterium]|nr:TetR/AcrR family transcriptional regulator C-terminal domain-containing protein [Solirubrobacteraceae bacterium]